jgi:hypothetical protein
MGIVGRAAVRRDDRMGIVARPDDRMGIVAT